MKSERSDQRRSDLRKEHEAQRRAQGPRSKEERDLVLRTEARRGRGSGVMLLRRRRSIERREVRVCGGYRPHDATYWSVGNHDGEGTRGYAGTGECYPSAPGPTSCGNVVSECSQSGSGGKPKYHKKPRGRTRG
jgi:hypothetical protein